MKPELKQYGDLTITDFERHPVWVCVHVLDYDEPWYGETNEETFRPWSEELPVDPSFGMFLVRSRMVLADGTQFAGFITPTRGTGEVTDSDLGLVQPHVFSKTGSLISFWGGLFGLSDVEKQKVYAMLERSPSQVFPISFKAEPGIALGRQSGCLRGFSKIVDYKKGTIETTM